MILNSLIAGIKHLFGAKEMQSAAAVAEPEVKTKRQQKAQRERNMKAVVRIREMLKASEGLFVIADVETTGVTPEDEIIELAAILADASGKVHERMATLVINVTKPLTSFVSGLTGITQTAIDRGGVPLQTALNQFMALAQNHPVFFHNAPFDKRFLAAAHQRCSRRFENPVYCTLSVAKALWPGRKSYKLVDLARMIGAPAPTHRSLDDVMATLALLMRQRAEALEIFSAPAEVQAA